MKKLLIIFSLLVGFTSSANAGLAENAIQLPSGLVAVKMATDADFTTYLLIKVVREGVFNSCKVLLPTDGPQDLDDIDCFEQDEFIEANHNGR